MTQLETGSASIMTTLSVNNQSVTVDAPPDTPLLWVLRDHLGMTGTKFGCGMALCGACTVHLEGQPVRSCRLALSAVQGRRVTTIEGIGTTRVGAAVQAAWDKIDVPQCGYCQSGQVLVAAALLSKNPTPTDSDIDDTMSGNICRCGTYARIRAAIHEAAESLQV
jgi:isoquinoline 1-oxidoreductase subunit alpha